MSRRNERNEKRDIRLQYVAAEKATEAAEAERLIALHASGKAEVVNIKHSNEYAMRCFRTAETVVLSNGQRLDRWCDESRNYDWVSSGSASRYAPGLRIGDVVELP